MVLFEWDEEKAKSNRRKHGITFDGAMQVFADPFALAAPERIEHGELRWQTIGMVAGVVVVLVAHTLRDEGIDEVVRIISARRATRKERTRYEQNRQKSSY